MGWCPKSTGKFSFVFSSFFLISPHPNPLPQGEREKIFDIKALKEVGENIL